MLKEVFESTVIYFSAQVQKLYYNKKFGNILGKK